MTNIFKNIDRDNFSPREIAEYTLVELFNMQTRSESIITNLLLACLIIEIDDMRRDKLTDVKADITEHQQKIEKLKSELKRCCYGPRD